MFAEFRGTNSVSYKYVSDFVVDGFQESTIL